MGDGARQARCLRTRARRARVGPQGGGGARTCESAAPGPRLTPSCRPTGCSGNRMVEHYAVSVRTGKDTGPTLALGCRFCGTPLELTMVDLGMSPPCQSLVRPDQLDAMERFYPLHARVCTSLLARADTGARGSGGHLRRVRVLLRLRGLVGRACATVRRDDPRRGSTSVRTISSSSWPRTTATCSSTSSATGVPILGIDPAANVAPAAEERGVPTLVDFFGREVARRLVDEGGHASLVIGNNVLAQVPDLNDFIAGVATLLSPARYRDVRVSTSAPSSRSSRVRHDLPRALLVLLVLRPSREILRAHGLEVYDVEELPTHGGSLRVYAQHARRRARCRRGRGRAPRARRSGGVFARRRPTSASRRTSTSRSARCSSSRSTFGATASRSPATARPARATRCSTSAASATDLIEYTVDRNPYKQGHVHAGNQIPIHPPERLAETRPDYIVVLPWNLIDEISAQLAYTSEWGAKLVVPIPRATVIEPGEGASERLAAAGRAA